VEVIGLPDPRYFLVHDDAIYGFKASLHTPVIYVRATALVKKITPAPASDRFIYYAARNTSLVVQELRAMNYIRSRRMACLSRSLNFLKLAAQVWTLRRASAWLALLRGTRAGNRGEFGRSKHY
jgi:GT2 family glycosyltransferase